MIDQIYIQDTITEDPRTQARRRIQHKRCLVCGARQLHNQQTSYFCDRHITTHRWCALCETLRPIAEHGSDWRCRGCSSARSLTQYYADKDRTLYRLKLRQMARRQQSRSDEIFDAVRRRIALAAFVAATPGWTWERRARAYGMNVTYIADSYRKQCRGLVRDADAAEREQRREVWR